MSSARAVSEPAPSAVPSPARPRLDSIDVVRGAVMILMALDHARDYFSHERANFFLASELLKVSVPVFFTRWVTHFCAPVFVFLAGTGAYFGGRRRTPRQLSWFLLTRGAWMIVLELTIVHFCWTFNFALQDTFIQVIWAIGVSMIVLAGLVFLPTWAVAAFGIVMVAVHNAFDAVRPETFGKEAPLWSLLHVPMVTEPAPGWRVFVAYPLIPWIGVMAAGYGFGALYRLEPARRARTLRGLGVGATVLFVVLRFSNLYGDPLPWSFQPKHGIHTLVSFLNCEKYPPSLLYLLMTLGPAILALSLLDGRAARGLLKPIVVYGRVPLFYYVLHILLLHVLASFYALGKYGSQALTFNPLSLPSDYGFPLPVVYAVWIGVVAGLYPACAWYARLKSRSSNPLLSYL